jgi:hypothetical protein
MSVGFRLCRSDLLFTKTIQKGMRMNKANDISNELKRTMIENYLTSSCSVTQERYGKILEKMEVGIKHKYSLKHKGK